MKRLMHMSSRREQRGAVAIIVGLTLAVLVGFAGLALDGGRLYVNKTELQNAADACALAASYELTGAPMIPAANFTQAHNAGMLVATRNRVGFQSGTIDGQDVTIQFGTSLSGGGWLTAASNPPATAVYVRCTIQETGISPWFMQMLGFGDQTVVAAATATLANAQTNCGIPLAMCSQGGPPPTFGFVAGQWYNGRFDAGGGLTGSFNWIDFSPPAGGASELTSLLTGNGVCDLNIPYPVGQTGVAQSTARAWNSRFGLYFGPTNVNNAPPDRTGYAYTPTNWPSQANALTDFLARRGTNDNYGVDVQAGNALTGLLINTNYNPTTTPAQHLQYGADRRLAVAPIVNCGEWEGSQTVPIRGWACILMLNPIDSPADIVYMEYEGSASDPTSPCATSGVVGGVGSIGPLVPGLVQ